MTPLERLTAVRPVWTGIARAGALFGAGRWLLHAGPPYASVAAVPAPVVSSAVLAILHEQWAGSEAEAEAMVRQGGVRLESAQAQRCVTPLAALVSPSTPLFVVQDAHGAAAPVYAPLGTTGGADLRFGTRDRAVLARLTRRAGEADALAAVLDRPVDLLALAHAGLAGGDDLHNRTTAATAALASELRARAAHAASAVQPALTALTEALAQTPLYFLTLWMAAARLILSAVEGDASCTLVTRMAGNGVEFGLSLAADPERWISVPAQPPIGAIATDAQPLGAIGDSAVIDALGFGAQALHLAPEPCAALQPYLPPDFESNSASLTSVPHPAFAAFRLRVGIDARAVASNGIAPGVTLGMIARDGRSGLLGRGVYVPPFELFARALGGIAERQRRDGSV